MKVIQPIAVTDDTLYSSSVPENDYPAWSSSVTYGVGDRVIVGHRCYESILAANIGKDPLALIAWVDIGPTNRWAMFDRAANAGTAAPASIIIQIALDNAADTLGLVDLQADSLTVEVIALGSTALFENRDAPAACEVFDLPPGNNRALKLTATGANVLIGKMITGLAFDPGDTEDGPTIGITDFSRRETDDFGVTTVVRRAWAKRMTTRSRLDSSAADEVQRRLARLRATPALWIGEADQPALTGYGFYKDFSIDLTIGSTSFCSLTVEGLPTADIAVAEVDPAPDQASTFHVVRPIAVTDALLAASNVAENDYPVWSAGTTYALGAHVILLATHRIYESLSAGNIGHDPSDVTNWLDIGPTNRWAMFDEALGTATERLDVVTVTLTAPGEVQALAALDLTAASVRVEAPGYDVTRALNSIETSATFIDLAVSAGQAIKVTITGSGLVSVGTLLFGTLSPLGVTQTAPTVGINDYSLKNTDDFGNTTPVERAWAKRMAVSAMVATPHVDGLLRRVAALRARPCLWIADDGFECLSIYGFYRDYSVELHDGISTSSVTIEGLSKAAPIVDPTADLRRLEAMIAALASDNLLSAGSEKSQAITNFNALSADYSALHERYLALGSPADVTPASDAATAAYGALAAYLGGLTPVWSITYVDTPVDGATWRARWIDAYDAVATFSAAITGRAGVSPPLITVSASPIAIAYDKAGAIASGDVTIASVRQNTSVTPTFGIYRADGTGITSPATAAALVAAYPTAFATSGPDNLTLKQTWLAGIIATYGSPVRVVAAAGTASDTVSLTKVQDGADGATGLNNATPTIYQRAAATPALPSAATTYTFASGGLSGLNNGWSLSVPEGNNPLYASTALASATTPTVSIAAASWSAPRIIAKDGVSGASGTNVTMSRPAATVWAYANGSVIDWSPASGQVKVESGGVDVTSSATFSAVTTAGMTGGINAAGAYSVSGMTTLTGTMTITVTYAGKTYTLQFGLTKQTGGYEIVATLPTTDLFQGREVFLTTDEKLYRYSTATSKWTTGVASVDVTGQLTDAQLASIAAAKITGQLVNAQIVTLDATKVTGQLSNGQIADLAAAKITGQINGTQITDGGITAIKIAAAAVTTAKLAASAVTANEIAANTIAAGNIAAGAIITSKLAAGAITANEIAANAITTPKIAAGSVTTALLAAGAVTANEIAANAITTPKIVAGAITTSLLAAGAVTANELSANAVTTNKLAAGAVTAAKIGVTELSAINANIGLITAGRIWSANGYTKIDLDNGTITFNNGVIMKVSGSGFGSSGQFLEWVGPTQSNLATCTEANAISYLKTNGAAYFGGTLSAGTLVNSRQTTTLAVDANVTTGVFGSNGKPRVVTVSYEFNAGRNNFGTCPASPITPTITVELRRGTDGSGAFIDSRTFTGTWYCERSGGPGEPGVIQENVSGSFTFTDNTGGTSAAFFARIVSISTNTYPDIQKLGVVSVEQ